MKKIISLLAATMMMFSFAAVSHADGTLTVTGSNATVDQNATGDDAKATVTFTLNFPEEISLLALQPEIEYSKTDLTLDSFTLSGESDTLTWATTDSNLDADYGAYISFDDNEYNGTAPADEYVVTLNFTVKDTSVIKSYDIKLRELVGTNTDYMGLEEVYPDFSIDGVKSTISVEAPQAQTTKAYFEATLTWGIKAKANTGVEFTFANANSTAKVPFGSVSFDDETEVKVGLEVTDVPADATLTLTDVDWYE